MCYIIFISICVLIGFLAIVASCCTAASYILLQYPSQAEIFAYLEDVATKNDLFSHLEFSTEVKEAR